MLFVILVIPGCSKVYEGKNIDPNNPSDVSPETLLRGIALANFIAQNGHVQRITGMWAGQYRGVALQYQTLWQYNSTAAESNNAWESIYYGVVKQARLIRSKIPNDRSFNGITKIIEANAIGTATALYGDVPFSQIADDNISTPVFDKQSDVYNQLQSMLDEAIADLNTSSAMANVVPTDLHFNGNAVKWKEVAHTLKARFYMETKNYPAAYAAALNGISATANSLKFYPPGVLGAGDANLLFSFVLQRGGYMSTNGSFLLDHLLNPVADDTRNNAKTNEDARAKYYTITGTSANNELGVANRTAPMPLVTYEENLLILAEAGLRTVDFNTGLSYLNQLRQVISVNLGFNSMPATGGTILYEDYVAGDFATGGMENMDNIDPERALLREIIEEKYVSTYGTVIPFNDMRRLRASDNDVNVPVPTNVITVTDHPERLVYAQNEINTNPNVPAPVPGIFSKTEVNQ